MFGFFGSMAMSCTRPVWMTGPMLRKVSPFSTSAVSRSDDAGAVRLACAPVAGRVAARNKAAEAATSLCTLMNRTFSTVSTFRTICTAPLAPPHLSTFSTSGILLGFGCEVNLVGRYQDGSSAPGSSRWSSRRGRFPARSMRRPPRRPRRRRRRVAAPRTRRHRLPRPHRPRWQLPDRLSDAEFWKLIGELSEPGGSFRSDNLLSNEVWLQHVIPELLDAAKPGRVYMGVGPEQNFTYIAALKPAMVFIVDVRRGNLQMHLMYKALFEMSADRAGFRLAPVLAQAPDGLTAASSVREIFQAFATAAADEKLFEENFKAIIDHLAKTHGFALEPEDVPGIRYIYEFFGRYGPDLTYWMSGGGGFGRGGFRNSPTYADLMVATDAAGTLRSYLASEENFNALKTLAIEEPARPRRRQLRRPEGDARRRRVVEGAQRAWSRRSTCRTSSST